MYSFLPFEVYTFVSSNKVAMKNCLYRCWATLALLVFLNRGDAQVVIAQNDLFNVLENSCSNYLNVTANDSSTRGIVSIQIITTPTLGTVTNNSTYLSYCANNGLTGADNFKYSITDGTFTDTATVYINIQPYNTVIYPGDADQNGRIENFDVLALGLTYGITGPGRVNSTSFNTLAWPPSPYINSNPGAADCDGNGIVNNFDLNGIVLSYGMLVPGATVNELDTSVCSSGLPFYLVSLSPDTIADGDTLNVLLKLGDDSAQNPAYGIAFTMGFNNGFIPGDGISFETNQSWLLQTDTGLFFSHNDQLSGKVDVALTKSNHRAAVGGGTVLKMRIPIEDNIDGIIQGPGWYNLGLQLERIRIISQYNVLIDVCNQSPNLQVYKRATGIHELENANLRVYPNPANGKIFIEAEKIEQIELTDLTGRKLLSRNCDPTDKVILDIKNLPIENGAYLIYVKGEGSTGIKKIIIQR